MEFEELSTDIQIIAANTLKDILVSGIYDGYEHSATDAAIHVRTAFEVLYGKKLSNDEGKVTIVIETEDHLKKFSDSVHHTFNFGGVTVHRKN